MDSDKKAVSYTQDWSDPERALEEIERAAADREQRETSGGWFEKLVKSSPKPVQRSSDKAADPEATARPTPRTRRRATPKP